MVTALGIAKEGSRVEWHAVDLETCDADASCLTIEVQSTAYDQSWSQEKDAEIRFNVARREWIWTANKCEWLLLDSPQRVADTHALRLLEEKDRETIDPLNASQWILFVVSKKYLDDRSGEAGAFP